MDYGMIGKIEKAKRYAQEHERFRFQTFSVKFHGDNNDHNVSYDDGKWTCDCEYFDHHEVCSHSMALEQLLSGMLPPREE
ncbi:MAG TPA: SWIM zinc finger family protein [Anaerolineales bacterium]|nr:SWIM zinc finger family protein [Anaerolineales bacterium]